MLRTNPQSSFEQHKMVAPQVGHLSQFNNINSNRADGESLPDIDLDDSAIPDLLKKSPKTPHKYFDAHQCSLIEQRNSEISENINDKSDVLILSQMDELCANIPNRPK